MKKIIFALCLTLFVAGCSSMVRNHDAAALKRVKRAAIIGFTVYQPDSAKVSLNVGSGNVEADRGGSLITKNSSHVDKMYLSLRRAFSTKRKWKMPDSQSMKAQSEYRKAYDQTMKGFQNKMPPPPGTHQLLVKGMMDFDALRILGQEGRERLMRALKVDAIIAATVRVNLSGTTIMGIGKRYPQARLSFTVYGRGSEKPIWFDGEVNGDVSETSVGATAFIDTKLLDKLSLQSAKTAFSKIGLSDTTL